MTLHVPGALALLDAARAGGLRLAVEPVGFPVLERLGIECPRLLCVASPGEIAAADLDGFAGDRVVVKVASSAILHRSDVGGVAVVERSVEAVRSAMARMEESLPAGPREGYTVSGFVPHAGSPGHEWLVGLRWTDDFGPVVMVGPGGLHAEFLAAHLDEATAILAVDGMTRERVTRRLSRLPLVRLVCETRRGHPPALPFGRLVDVVCAFGELARAAMPVPLFEIEINPLAVSGGRLVALDVLARLEGDARLPAPPRPRHKIARLLAPRRVAIAGVSTRQNPGRVILDNLLALGYPRDGITAIKPGVDQIAGVAAVPDVASLAAPVDLLVLAIAAREVPAAVATAADQRKAEAIIVIPGGLEEKTGTEALVASMREALARARQTGEGGPVVNGGNCLGIRSVPGRYDTMFIPQHKLGAPAGDAAPLALVSQSGAFAIARMGKLAFAAPRYVVTLGNQMDLTIGDYVAHFAGEADVEVVAVYVEGFKPGDGREFLRAARDLTESGRQVIFYRAGRTAAGAAASSSHTASIAGDYAVSRDLAREAGVIVAESLEAFEDLVTTFSALRGRVPAGRRVGAVSNAGFECVAIADALVRSPLARFDPTTTSALATLLAEARIDGLVDIHNPLDLTPMADDATFDAAVGAVADCADVDLVVVGCVPLTPALQTLERGPAHAEDLERPDALAARLGRRFAASRKPWVVVVDAGPLYDPFAAALARHRLPVFRTADRAVGALDAFVAASLTTADAES
ncbi:MAG: acetate--CoA ligase family protein [Acidobacteria bacterium]|nr:acetate--CoA ligase family protein [Acidobacteriota bacterium]